MHYICTAIHMHCICSWFYIIFHLFCFLHFKCLFKICYAYLRYTTHKFLHVVCISINSLDLCKAFLFNCWSCRGLSVCFSSPVFATVFPCICDYIIVTPTIPKLDQRVYHILLHCSVCVHEMFFPWKIGYLPLNQGKFWHNSVPESMSHFVLLV